MRLQAISALCSLLVLAHAHALGDPAQHIRIARQQLSQQPSAQGATTTSSTSSQTSSPTTQSSATASSSTSTSSSDTYPSSSPTSTDTTGSTSATSSGSSSSASSTGPVIPSYDPNGIPPLVAMTSGMPTGTTYAAAQTFTPGSKPTGLPGAPPIPSFVVNPAQWPPMDKVPPTDSPQVQAWLKELDGIDIPDLRPTINGSCDLDPEAKGQAEQRGWWSCGGWTRPTDIISCPDPLTWGVSFDDGPSGYTQKLLNYMNQKQLQATFFVVGSRAIQYPDLLKEEYMSGNEISVHTWSHRPLTSLTTEQIVGELGWTRLAIQRILGITPTTMRPPFGDIDDRVRAISLAMGMVPIMWSRAPSGLTFDTNDWRVAGGLTNGTNQMQIFESILDSAATMNTGFVVLAHDLYEIAVDLAVGYTLPAAMEHNPPFNLKRIGECNRIPITNMYVETNKNATFPKPGATNATHPIPGGASAGLGADGLTKTAGGSGGSDSPGDANSLRVSTLGALVAVSFAVLGAMF